MAMANDEMLKMMRVMHILTEKQVDEERKSREERYEMKKKFKSNGNKSVIVVEKINTVAYNAEKEIDESLYNSETAMFKPNQFSKANSVTLNTTYEQIKQYWEVETRFREGFKVEDNVVNMPVIFAKISGVKDGNIEKYWRNISNLIQNDNTVYNTVSAKSTSGFYERMSPSDVYDLVDENKTIMRRKLMRHPEYRYGILRKDIQDMIIDKIQVMLDTEYIVGTWDDFKYENIVASLMNLPQKIVQMLQDFDFTKHNPKMITIRTNDDPILLEEAILLAFLNLIGFDLLVYVPTGYRLFEQYYNYSPIQEINIGEFIHNIDHIPNLNMIPKEPSKKKEGFFSKLFGRD